MPTFLRGLGWLLMHFTSKKSNVHDHFFYGRYEKWNPLFTSFFEPRFKSAERWLASSSDVNIHPRSTSLTAYKHQHNKNKFYWNTQNNSDQKHHRGVNFHIPTALITNNRTDRQSVQIKIHYTDLYLQQRKKLKLKSRWKSTCWTSNVPTTYSQTTNDNTQW